MKRIALTISILLVGSVAFAKAKVISEPDKSYDFKAVEKIVVDPITSINVDFGKVDAERLAKIQAILEKTKKNLRTNLVDGAKNAKSSIPFYSSIKGKKDRTLVLKFNIDQFDNGNMAKRLVPFAGKAKVKMSAKFVDAKSNKIVAEVSGEAKEKGGVVPGGLDSECLYRATNMANYHVMQYLKKLTGIQYDYLAAIPKAVKPAVKSQADVMKEEKQEKDIYEKKKKKK